ncbi:MAG: polyprenyl synthetase family protein [bacterium]|nr:polyprenyl synthetase family protein [bacterium]
MPIDKTNNISPSDEENLDFDNLLSLINGKLNTQNLQPLHCLEIFNKIKIYTNKLLDKNLTECEAWSAILDNDLKIYDIIKNFILSNGKRLRPILFFLTYMAFEKKPDRINADNIMSTLEIIHTFILIHDDIIDKSSVRRSSPTLHTLFNDNIKTKGLNESHRITGEDMALVAGDMLYTYAFDSIHKVNLPQKVSVEISNILTKTAMLTAHGEFHEMLETLKPIENIKEKNLLRLYDLKTAYYTFCAPMALGAILADKHEKLNIINDIGLAMGRAFQILNDISELKAFNNAPNTYSPKDLIEKKYTLILYWAYNSADKNDKQFIDDFLSNNSLCMEDYIKIYKIMIKTGSIKKATTEIYILKKKAVDLLRNLDIDNNFRTLFHTYFNQLIPHEL